jgi:polysaccharide export outer membrane protein
MCIRTSNICALLLAILVLAACAKVSVLGTDAPRATVVLSETYVLGPGDELNIVVFNNEDLSDNFVVSEAGTISLPLVGQIRAAGRTTDAVQQKYSDLLANGYLVNPRVGVSISVYRPFFIIGGVKNPGAYPYQSGMTILHAIALSGGHSELAIRNFPPLLKRASGALVSGETVSVYTPVFPGDVVEIPERSGKK